MLFEQIRVPETLKTLGTRMGHLKIDFYWIFWLYSKSKKPVNHWFCRLLIVVEIQLAEKKVCEPPMLSYCYSVIYPYIRPYGVRIRKYTNKNTFCRSMTYGCLLNFQVQKYIIILTYASIILLNIYKTLTVF